MKKRPENSKHLANIQNISSIKETEAALDKSECKFRDMLESINLIAVMLDEQGMLLYCNDFFLNLTGWKAEEILHKNWFSLAIPEHESDKAQQRFLNGTIPQYYESEIVTRSGEHRLIAWNHTFSQDPDGKFQGATSIGEDITHRRHTENQIQLQLRRLAALRTIDLAITSSLDVRVVLNVLIDQVVAQLEVDAANIMLLDPNSQILEHACGRGFLTTFIQQSSLRIGQGLAGKAAFERRSISVPNFAQFQDQFIRESLIAVEGFKAYYAIPLITKGQVKGVLEIFNRTLLNPNTEWLDYLETLAGQTAIAIENATLFAELQQSHDELAQAYVTTLEGWVKTLGLRDDETEDHAHRVASMTLRLAKAIGMTDHDLVHIRRGALLHDIGKMAVPDHILLKDGPLDDEEWDIMRRHPIDAFELLSPITYLRPALEIPYCHHEKWDGTGYPRGLRAEQIPISARLFAVADVWDALRSDRPYRKAWPYNKALEYIREQQGKHFDPSVVELFFSSAQADPSMVH
jgi:PAS domain S-box-containing protein/putative nucleotidyltransferase with HDIG domain